MEGFWWLTGSGLLILKGSVNTDFSLNFKRKE